MTTALPRIEGEGFVLRPWQAGDLELVVLHADDESVSRAVSNRFPFPYSSGFEREGTLRRAVIRKGRILDLCMYAMLRTEPSNQKQNFHHD